MTSETSVTRTVQLDAATDTVWEAIADPEQRAHWLDDDDAAGRAVRVDIAISPRVGGGTSLVVTETPLRALSASVTASASASLAVSGTRRWDHRLLGLELLFVAAGACVL